MKTIILCGGRGTRLGEHGATVPKALINIGGKPIIWHLLKIFSSFGHRDFILCLGFLGNKIKQYLTENNEDWNIVFAETGLDTNTGGRIKKVEKYLQTDEQFFVTYGDGLANVNLNDLQNFHHSHGKIGTLTAVHPFSNFGIIKLNEEKFVTEFQEKPRLKEWVNGGFFIFNRQIFNYLDEDCVLEKYPLETLAKNKDLVAFEHTGFWKCMDTFKDNLEFNQIWEAGNADWKTWKD
ncbi:MAG TPA: sugar phosphate nucleotidyltransferase [Pyrinomonadaceae bacterium]|nr:sugar phosphate nucleotidyltransferase [Pyrinomonadaceae bacterium]